MMTGRADRVGRRSLLTDSLCYIVKDQKPIFWDREHADA
jgi:hypothetical protein